MPSPSTELAAAEPSALAFHAAFLEAQDPRDGDPSSRKAQATPRPDEASPAAGIALIIAVATAIRWLALAAGLIRYLARSGAGSMGGCERVPGRRLDLGRRGCGGGAGMFRTRPG